eukprot:gene4534-7911_t
MTEKGQQNDCEEIEIQAPVPSHYTFNPFFNFKPLAMKNPYVQNLNSSLKVPLPPKTLNSGNNGRSQTYKPERKRRPSKRNSKNVCCANCNCETSPLWRKGEGKKVLCNKCGLYWSRHGMNRPLTLEKERKTRRSSSPVMNFSQTQELIFKNFSLNDFQDLEEPMKQEEQMIPNEVIFPPPNENVEENVLKDKNPFTSLYFNESLLKLAHSPTPWTFPNSEHQWYESKSTDQGNENCDLESEAITFTLDRKNSAAKIETTSVDQKGRKNSTEMSFYFRRDSIDRRNSEALFSGLADFVRRTSIDAQDAKFKQNFETIKDLTKK